MTERVVDLLEIVEVETHHGRLGPTGGHGNGLFHPLLEHGPVWQFGESVMPSHEHDPGFGLMPDRHILMGRHPAAPWHGLMVDGDEPPVAEFHHTVVRRHHRRDGILPPLQISRCHYGHGPGLDTVGDDLRPWTADTGGLRRQIVNLHVPPVPKQQSLFTIEKSDALGDVVQHRIEPPPADFQFVIGLQQTGLPLHRGSDVPASAAIPRERPVVVKDRIAVGAHEVTQAVRTDPFPSKIAKWHPCLEVGLMPGPAFFAHRRIANLPAAFSGVVGGNHEGDAGIELEAKIRVLFPEPIGGHLGERPQLLLPLGEPARCLFQFDILFGLPAQLPCQHPKQPSKRHRSNNGEANNIYRLAPPHRVQIFRIQQNIDD